MALLSRASRSRTTLERLDRLWRAVSASRRGRIDVGDFGRRLPSRGSDQDSVYDALVSRFLRQQLEGLMGEGLVLGVDEKAKWVDVLPAREGLAVRLAIGQPEHALAAVAAADWVVLDRWLQHLPDVTAAFQEVARLLKPGARVLTLFTGIACPEPGEHSPLWSVAPYAARRLHEECRELERVEVEQYGNVTLALAWIYRLPADDLTERELAAVDPAYPVLVAVTAWKRGRCR
jgi:SAM-dependent methyltransferase